MLPKLAVLLLPAGLRRAREASRISGQPGHPQSTAPQVNAPVGWWHHGLDLGYYDEVVVPRSARSGRIDPKQVIHEMDVVLHIPLAESRLEPMALAEKGRVDVGGSHHRRKEFIDVLKHKDVLILRLIRPRLMRATPGHEDHRCRNADRITAIAKIFPFVEVGDHRVEAIKTGTVYGSLEIRPQGMKIVTIGFLLEFFHLLRETIGWNASEQPELRKHLDCMVEEIRCNLKVVERSEATGYVVLERSVQVVVRIVDARHGAESMPAITRQGGRRLACGGRLPPSCREPCGLLPTMQWSPGEGLALRLSLWPSPPGGNIFIRAGRATPCAISSGHRRYLADSHGHLKRAVMLGTCR